MLQRYVHCHTFVAQVSSHVLNQLSTRYAPRTYCSSHSPRPRDVAEMNTLMGIKGRDFVLLGGDSAFFRSVVVMDVVSFFGKYQL